MPINAVNPTDPGVSILFADPTQPLPSLPALEKSDAICLDLDRCSFEGDGSLGSECLTLLKDAEKKHVDVILAAKEVRFYEVPGLDDFSVTLVEKPESGLTGSDLADWLAGELSRVMGLTEGVKRGFQRSRSVGKTEPGKVAAVHLESNLSEEQQRAFLHFVSGHKPAKAVTKQAQPTAKMVAVKAGQYLPKGVQVIKAKSGAIVKAHSGEVIKAAKADGLKAAKRAKTMAAIVSGAGPRRKA